MFYSKEVLAKKGPLAKIWIAAHWERKITKDTVIKLDIHGSVEDVLNGAQPIALRTSGHLLLGIVRIYSRKVKYLYTDCNEALVKIKMAYHPGNVDLPLDQLTARHGDITLTMGENMDFTEIVIPAFNISDLPDVAAFEPIFPTQLTIGAHNLSRKEDITMEDHQHDGGFNEEGLGTQPEGGFGVDMDGEDGDWIVFNPSTLVEGMDIEIEAARGIEVEMREVENPMENLLEQERPAQVEDDAPMFFDDEPIPSGSQINLGGGRPSLADSMNLGEMMESPALSRLGPVTPAATQDDVEFGVNFQSPDIKVKRAYKRRRGVEEQAPVDEVTKISAEEMKRRLDDYSGLVREDIDVVDASRAGVERRFYQNHEQMYKKLAPFSLVSARSRAYLEKCLARPIAKKLRMVGLEVPTMGHGDNEEEVERPRGARAEEAAPVDQSYQDDAPIWDTPTGKSQAPEQDRDEPPLAADEQPEPMHPEETGAPLGGEEPAAEAQRERGEEGPKGDLSFMTAHGEDEGVMDEIERQEREEEAQDAPEGGEDVVHSGWTFRSRRMLHHLQGAMTKDGIVFNDMVARNKRRTVAQCFFELLVLQNKEFIDVKQAEPFGQIDIHRGRRFNTDAKVVA